MGLISTAILSAAPVERNADNDTDDTTYIRAAIEMWRSHILAVPGSGSILGCVTYNGVDYAWRNNGSAAVMHKSTANGFVEVDLGETIEFDTGNNAIVSGDTLIGLTSGATCTVNHVDLLSGTWAGGDAAGLIHYTTHHGSFVVGDVLRTTRLSPTTSAEVTVTAVAVAWPAGGLYEFDIYNFGGHSGTRCLYGVNGVGYGFQFDGSSVIFIRTGMATDTPQHVKAHKNHLFYSFPGGSVQHSSRGVPLTFSALTGAAEIGLGDEITGFESVPGGQMAIFGRNSTAILQGTSVDDWVLSSHSFESGAIERSIQGFTEPIYFDDRGITTLSAAQEFGDFKDNVVSVLVQPYLEQRTSNVTASMVVKEKSQFRVFFEDNTALYLTFRGHKLQGATVIDLGVKVNCCWSGENSDGTEVLLFGSTGGYLYRLDSGTSFDGSEIAASIRLPFHHYGSPNLNKRFLRATVELTAKSGTSLTVYPDFAYSDSDAPSSIAQDFSFTGGGGFWDAAIWGSFVWSASPIGEADGYIDGLGRNLGLLIIHNATYEEPHTLHGLRVEYSVKNRRR
jgi:hypothetical protein